MTELERNLTLIGGELSYPPTPEIGPGVAERVRGARAPRSRPARRTLVLAALLVLLLAAAAVAAVPAARHRVLDWLGLRSVHVERVNRLPRPPSGGGKLALGRPTTLAAARARVGFPVLVPAMGPGSVYVGRNPTGGRVTFVYSRPTMLITEFRGRQSSEFLGKTLGPGTTARPVRVNGEPGIWIAGHPHLVLYMDARGHVYGDTLRLATNTLVFRRGPVLVRIEAHVPEAEALRVARSMR